MPTTPCENSLVRSVRSAANDCLWLIRDVTGIADFSPLHWLLLMVDAVPRHQDTTNLHTFARGGSKLFFLHSFVLRRRWQFPSLCSHKIANYVFYCGLLFREENHTSGTTATLTYGQQQQLLWLMFFFRSPCTLLVSFTLELSPCLLFAVVFVLAWFCGTVSSREIMFIYWLFSAQHNISEKINLLQNLIFLARVVVIQLGKSRTNKAKRF